MRQAWKTGLSQSFLSSGFAGAALFFGIREGVLYPRRTKEQRRQAVVKRKLEKLYTPHYMLIKYSGFILRDKQPTLTYMGDSGKKDLDSLTLNYGYLAEDELMELLGPWLRLGRLVLL